MVNALLAGTLVALLAAAIGWFMVIRRQSFAGHTLGTMSFPGAGAALLVGVPAAWGYFVAATAAALTLGRAAGRADESARIGAVGALGLGVGYLFVSLSGNALSGLETLLFGTFVGISDAQVAALAAVTVGALAVLAAIGRPLLLASLDPERAAVAGRRPGILATAFLVLLGLAVAAAAQVTGALLVFALLVTPAATAQVLTANPLRSLALTVAIAVAVVWLGLGVAYFSVYPAGFYVTTVAFGLYLAARAARRLC